MKLCLAILLISFLSIEAHGSRVKRGLSADEKKKFLEALNKDRDNVATKSGFPFVPVEYDASLEEKIVSGKTCLDHKQQMPLRINDGAEKLWKNKMATFEGNIYNSYFDPYFDKIGCSKTAKCTEVLINKENDAPPELEGTTIEYYGLCLLGSSETQDPKRKRMNGTETLSPNKYGDIIGVVAGSGAGAGNLIISLFLVLYI